MTDRVVAARRFVDDLVRAEQLEVRRPAVLAADLAAYVDLLGRAPSGGELEDWLGEHRQVEELYAGKAALDALSDRYFRPPAPISVTELHEPALFGQLTETLDADPYLVYADWLQERGDPLGELIVLGVAATAGGAEAKQRFAQHLERNDKLFLRDIRRSIGSAVRFEWHNGFITSIDEVLDALGNGGWKRLFELRVTMLVRSITLQDHRDPEVDALIAEHAPALRELRLRYSEYGLVVRQLPRALLATPSLRSLAISKAELRLEPELVPPKLERLELQVRELERDPRLVRLEVRVLVLARSQWRVEGSTFGALDGLELATLEELELAGIDGPVAATCAILDGMAMPALRSLVIRGCTLGVADVARIASLKVAPRLARLALIAAQLRDDTLPALRPMRALAELDVGDNELTPSGVAFAGTLATRLVVGKQHHAGTAAIQAIRAFAAGRFAAGEDIADPAQWRDAGVADSIRWARYTGSEPYELFVTVGLDRYGCSCPSRYQPCKHVIALALVAERDGLPRAPSGGIEDRVGI